MGGTRRKDLKTLPLRVMTAGICLVAILLTAYFFYSLNRAEEKQLKASSTLLALLDDNMLKATNELRTFAMTVAYNAAIQRSLLATEYDERILTSGIFYEVGTIMMKTNDFIDDVAVFTSDLGVFRNLSVTITYLDYKETLKEFLGRTAGGGGEFLIIPSCEGSRYFSYVLPMLEMRDRRISGGTIGYCLVGFSLPRIDEYSRKVLVYKGARTGIVMDDGTVLPSGAGQSGDFRAAIGNPGRYLIDSRPVEGLGCTLYTCVPKSEVIGERLSYLVLSFSLLAVLLGILAIIGVEFSKAFAVPLDDLTRQLAVIDGSDRDVRITSLPDNEIGEIATGINRMLDKIHDLTRKDRLRQAAIHELELARKQAELSALHSQINPHFLHNTLECIRSIAMDFGAEQIVGICTSLADILSYSLDREEEVPLDREIESVERYLEIISIRFGGRYRYAVHVDEAARRVVVPRMILQPVVENAVFHGLEKCREGSLEITGAGEDGAVVIRVADTGAGMDAAVLADLKKRLQRCLRKGFEPGAGAHGIGLPNTQRRLVKRYGKGYGIGVESREGAGTEVTIRVPRGADSAEAPDRPAGPTPPKTSRRRRKAGSASG